MPRLHEIPIGESISLLLYGKSGAGKTYFGGSAGKDSIFIDVGNGIATLTSKNFREKYPDANPEVITIRETTNDRGLAIKPTGFDEVCDTLDEIFTKPGTFKSIIIDDLTSLTQLALNKAFDLNKDSSKSQTLATAQRNRAIPLTAVQDYGTLIDILKFFLGTYITKSKEAGRHFILLAHERTVYKPAKMGEDAKLFRVFPHAPGKDNFAPSVLPAFFDEVYHIELKGNTRTIRTRPNEIYLAKTRYAGELKEFEDNLDFPKWIEKIAGLSKEVQTSNSEK